MSFRPRSQLSAGRSDFRKWLQANAPSATITSEYDIVFNGVAVELNGTSLTTIAAAPMVERAAYSVLYHPTLSESYKIINATNAWNRAGGRSVACAGIKIGDTAKTRIASTSRQKSLLPKFSIIKPDNRASTHKQSKITGYTQPALRLE